MSELEIRHRLETAVRPAFDTPVDAAADLARGRRGRRRRRAVQASTAGASVCAIAGAVAIAGVPFAAGGGSSDDGPDTIVTSPDGPAPTEWRLDLGRVDPAVREHLGLEHTLGSAHVGRNEPLGYVGWVPMHEDGESMTRLLVQDAVRAPGAPLPLRCANDPAYDSCQRETLPDGSDVVVGQGADDLLVLAWGPGGDLVEVAAHWAPSADHNLTLDQLIGLAGDDRLHVGGEHGRCKTFCEWGSVVN
jgi:hypothetical protein